ncbi:hypothetical protein B0H10DRAFT_2227794 [Mycena sp. CBHHK59/15]|nr:hypothetical protein B0H10DRAFT_2227794 [Mycena sp. CBHHK59/15]
MPPSIPAWERALMGVDRTRPTQSKAHSDTYYVFPEPALLVSPGDYGRRQMFLHHFSLIRDALLYRLGDPDDPHDRLSSHEWRDVLQGKLVKQGRLGTKAYVRSAMIADILGPAMRTCEIDQLHNFPVAPESVPRITNKRAKEILWDIAEMNFRYELLALDARASGIDRPEECRQCFADAVLLGLDIGLSKRGLAAVASAERHPYLLQLARLMCDWRCGPRPDIIAEAGQRTTWTMEAVAALEDVDAGYYAQSFYDLFGRAAVIPMRLKHEFGT